MHCDCSYTRANNQGDRTAKTLLTAAVYLPVQTRIGAPYKYNASAAFILTSPLNCTLSSGSITSRAASGRTDCVVFFFLFLFLFRSVMPEHVVVVAHENSLRFKLCDIWAVRIRDASTVCSWSSAQGEGCPLSTA